jgi:hypothetical protein
MSGLDYTQACSLKRPRRCGWFIWIVGEKIFIFHQRRKFSLISCNSVLQVFDVARTPKPRIHVGKKTTFADCV